MTTDIDDIDRVILNRIQSAFPVSSRPYSIIAADLNLPEDEVIKRISDLKKKGIIRRIGGNFVPNKLGFVSTLCAAKVPEASIKEFSKAINRYAGVTHNYLRDDPYNIWFTFIAQSMEEIEAHIEKISEETGIKDILNLPAVKIYKIRAHFNL